MSSTFTLKDLKDRPDEVRKAASSGGAIIVGESGERRFRISVLPPIIDRRDQLIKEQAETIELLGDALRSSRKWDGPNQPCGWCGVEEGTHPENGFNRCNKCGEPGK